MEIGDRVKALREKRGISQAEFARLAGEARSTVHNWETNRNKPDTDSMRTVARVLETSISYLYGETDDQRPAPSWSTPTELDARATIAGALEDLQRAQQRLSDLRRSGRGRGPTPCTSASEPGWGR